ncbi:MAG TPA: alpha-ketoglutarate-dependent dioxygenase AlkB [Mycobacteriales bacterium]|nr:alpha-ketoglutarate-dependent dioxygenase AlkB [Mycobacteriales bacterium]
MFERVATVPELVWQPGLALGLEVGGAPLPPDLLDSTFTGLVRHVLDARSWVDVVPGWLRGPDVLFDRLLREAEWTAREVPMYDRIVAEPRLTALFAGEPPAPLAAIREALRDRYATPFDSVAVNLYRDGRDSVAWHGDRVRHLFAAPMVATVTLGAPRRFLLRPRTGGRALMLRPGPGDLVVMGGACQREWQHCVPKTTRAVGPRMAVTVRHLTAPHDPEVSAPGS